MLRVAALHVAPQRPHGGQGLAALCARGHALVHPHVDQQRPAVGVDLAAEGARQTAAGLGGAQVSRRRVATGAGRPDPALLACNRAAALLSSSHSCHRLGGAGL